MVKQYFAELAYLVRSHSLAFGLASFLLAMSYGIARLVDMLSAIQ